MSTPVNNQSQANFNQNHAEQTQKAQQDFDNQLKMLDLQRQVNANNTLITAISTLEKGKDDVSRAMANNLK